MSAPHLYHSHKIPGYITYPGRCELAGYSVWMPIDKQSGPNMEMISCSVILINVHNVPRTALETLVHRHHIMTRALPNFLELGSSLLSIVKRCPNFEGCTIKGS